LSSLDWQFDVKRIAAAKGEKSVTLDFAVNVLHMFLLNMKHVEFEGRR
jgi:hypothetical protein